MDRFYLDIIEKEFKNNKKLSRHQQYLSNVYDSTNKKINSMFEAETDNKGDVAKGIKFIIDEATDAILDRAFDDVVNPVFGIIYSSIILEYGANKIKDNPSIELGNMTWPDYQKWIENKQYTGKFKFEQLDEKNLSSNISNKLLDSKNITEVAIGLILSSDPNIYTSRIQEYYGYSPAQNKNLFIEKLINKFQQTNANSLSDMDVQRECVRNLIRINKMTVASLYHNIAREYKLQEPQKNKLYEWFISKDFFPEAKGIHTTPPNDFDIISIFDAKKVLQDSNKWDNVIVNIQETLIANAQKIDNQIDTAYATKFGVRLKNDKQNKVTTKQTQEDNYLNDDNIISIIFDEIEKNEVSGVEYSDVKTNTPDKKLDKPIQQKNIKQERGTELFSDKIEKRHAAVRYILCFIILYCVGIIFEGINDGLSTKKQIPEEYFEGVIKSIIGSILGNTYKYLTRIVKQFAGLPLNMTTIANSGSFNKIVDQILNMSKSDNKGFSDAMTSLGLGQIGKGLNAKYWNEDYLKEISNEDFNSIVSDAKDTANNMITQINSRTIIKMLEQVYEPTKGEKIGKEILSKVEQVRQKVTI